MSDDLEKLPFSELMARLSNARASLGDAVSYRALSRKAGTSESAHVSQTSVRNWFTGKRFPRDNLPQWLVIVAAIRAVANRRGLLDDDLDRLTRADLWIAAHQAGQGGHGAALPAADRPGAPPAACDPIRLGVKPAIASERAGTTPLPVFVRRVHDATLRRAITAGGVVAVVGGSSTGKSRSCWEAVQKLEVGWRVWRPGDWDDLARIGPNTVIWLDEPRTQMDPARARRLADLVADPARAPVTVLVQMWDEDWRAFHDGESPEIVRLLQGAESADAVIDVPSVFTPANRLEWVAALESDPRLARAAEEAGAEITQFLAGAHALLAVYRRGSAMTKALITAAVDACRLGVREPLRVDFLAEAATDYPTNAEWLRVQDHDWLPAALAEARAPVNGLPGPLRTAGERARGGSTSPDLLLAPYVAELGEAERRTMIPPESFWAAALQHGTPAEQGELARRADGYGLYRIGAELRKRAVTAGYAAHPVRLLLRVPDAGEEAVQWTVENAPVTDLQQVNDLGDELERRGHRQARTALYRRAAVTTDLSSTTRGAERFLETLIDLRDSTAITALLAHEPGTTLPLDTGSLSPLAKLDHAEGTRLAGRFMAGDDPAWAVQMLLQAGFQEVVSDHIIGLTSETKPSVEELARMAGVLCKAELIRETQHLLGLLDLTGDGVEDTLSALNRWQVEPLLRALHAVGPPSRLADAVAAINRLGLLRPWYPGRDDQLAGLVPEVTSLLILDPKPPPPPPASPGPGLRLSLRRYPLAEEEASKFPELSGLNPTTAHTAVRAADIADLTRLMALLWHLRADGQHEARAELVRRCDPDLMPDTVGSLCGVAVELGPGGAGEAVMTHVVAVCGPWYSKTTRLVVLDAIEKIDAAHLVEPLAWRIADAGNFDACVRLLPKIASRYRYGRTPDGQPSAAWSWADVGTSR